MREPQLFVISLALLGTVSYPCQLLGTAIVLPGQPPVFLFYLSAALLGTVGYPCQLLGTAIVLPGQPPAFLFHLPACVGRKRRVHSIEASSSALKCRLTPAATSFPSYNID